MNAFLNASELMGVPKEFLAKASDVVEGKNRMRTVQTIFLLSLAAEKKKLRVPFLQHPYVFLDGVDEWWVGRDGLNEVCV